MPPAGYNRPYRAALRVIADAVAIELDPRYVGTGQFVLESSEVDDGASATNASGYKLGARVGTDAHGRFRVCEILTKEPLGDARFAMSWNTTTRRRFTMAIGAGGIGLGSVGTAAARGHGRNFRASLAGEHEVPPVATRARGLAKFQLTSGGDTLRYKLIVANIENVTMAHIHLAARDENGPVVAWLYPTDGPPPALIEGRFSGVLAEGTITADDLVGPLEGESLEDLLAELRQEMAYVNVHTEANPGGEVRGQIR